MTKSEFISNSPYGLISKYRSELMGLSILWVVLFHSSIDLNFFPFSEIKSIGYGGVDIFLLVSGIGIYKSLEKNSISRFIKNRAKKIVPIWWTYLFLCVVLGSLFFKIHFSKMSILGYATFTGYWLDMPNQGNWYVYAIMLFYLFSPVIFSLLKESKNKTLMCSFLVIITLILSFAFLKNSKLMAFSRIPIYIIGLYFSCKLNKKALTRKNWIICILLMIIGFVTVFSFIKFFPDYLWSYGLWWYPFILIAPTFSIFVCKIFSCLEKYIHFLLLLLKKLGQASLEILLVSDYIFARIEETKIILGTYLLTSIIVFVFAIVLGVLFHMLIELMKNLLAICYRKAIKRIS